MNRIIFLVLTLIIFQCCAWLDKSEHIIIIGDYDVGWNDLESNRSIARPANGCSGCYDIIVDGYVYAVGHNENFIIAKQHPNLDTGVTHYYIVDIATNLIDNTKGVKGPMDKDNFDKLSRQLNISHLSFDLNFDESPD
jgi:hypothetical protein